MSANNYKQIFAKTANFYKETAIKILENVTKQYRTDPAAYKQQMEDLLLALLDHSDSYVRSAAAGHTNASETVLLKALDDEDRHVRNEAWNHPNFNDEIRAKYEAKNEGDINAIYKTFDLS